MHEPDTAPRAPRFLASGDESGTAPEDRPFRPDVEGLRAVAVLLVVLFHSGVSGVVRRIHRRRRLLRHLGFVITGVLLRERVDARARTSILVLLRPTLSAHPPRRDPGHRRHRGAVVLLPLGHRQPGAGPPPTGGGPRCSWPTSTSARSGPTTWPRSSRPRRCRTTGPCRSRSSSTSCTRRCSWRWRAMRPTLSLRARLAIGLVVVIGASLAFSVLDTASHPTSAYFSPFTRAWELALGALVAVGTPWIKKTVPSLLAALATWVGLGAVLYGAVRLRRPDRLSRAPWWRSRSPGRR